MAGEPLARLPPHAAFVTSQVRSFVNPGFKNRSPVRGIHFEDVARTNATVAFDKRYACLLRRRGLKRRGF